MTSAPSPPRQRGEGVNKRLFTGFALQLGAILVSVILIVFAASWIIQNIFVRSAIEREAALFEQRLVEDPTLSPPVTVNLTGYYVPHGTAVPIPEYLKGLGPGFSRLDAVQSGLIAHVSEVETGRIILVYDKTQLMRLAFYFGLIPLGIILVVTWLLSWMSYRMSHQAVSPLVRLAARLEKLDLNHPDQALFDLSEIRQGDDKEVAVLANALDHLNERLNRFVERERNFTRDASHELRSPVTVIQMATEMLLEEGQLGDYERRTVMRISSVARDMQALTEAMLVLARESGEGLAIKEIDINDMVADEIRRYRYLVRHKQVEIRVSSRGRLLVQGPPSVATVMVSNLIRNACAYTDHGEVHILIGSDHIIVDDTGVGMSAAEVENAFKPYFRGQTTAKGGHGVGLTIVKRLSDRFKWPVEIESEPGVGTRATIRFPYCRHITEGVTVE